MSRLPERHYTSRVLIAMTFYTGFMLIAWPLVRTTTSYPLRVCIALAPVIPMVYVIGLMIRRILNSDELEQRMHLVGLGVATAVVGLLSLIGGFLSAGDVLKLDGTVLIWVFPVMMMCYGVTRWTVSRRYGVDAVCDDGAAIPRYIWFLLGGCLGLGAAWLSRHSMDAMSEGFLLGLGGSFFCGGLIGGVLRWQRRNHVRE